MEKTIKARFMNNAFVPLEKLEIKLEEGEEVAITVSERSTPLKAEKIIKALRATAGGWSGLIDAEEFKRNIYADRLISTRPKTKKAREDDWQFRPPNCFYLPLSRP